MSNIDVAGSPIFTILNNKMRYIISSGGNNSIILPNLYTQTDPITIINTNVANVTIADDNSIGTSSVPPFSTVMPSQTSMTIIPSKIIGSYTISEATSTENTSYAAPLIPLLIQTLPAGSSSGWFSSSDSGVSSLPQNPWIGDITYIWNPFMNPSYVQITNGGSFLISVTKVGISTIVGTPNITSLVISAVNSTGTFTTLLTYTAPIVANTTYILGLETTPPQYDTLYSAIRFTMTFATLPRVGQGVNFLQLYGTY